MANELKVRSFRIEDEVWEAVRAHEMSANQLLKMALGMTGVVAKVFAPPKDFEVKLPSAESWRRGPRQKGDKGR